MGTSEGEEVDLLTAFLELVGWEVNDKEKEEGVCFDCCLIKFVEPGLSFFCNERC